MNHIRRTLAILGAAALLAACGSSPMTSPKPTAGPTAAPATATAPSTTPASSPSMQASAPPSFIPPTVATLAPADAGSATWDLVALGDSNVAGVPFGPQDAFPGVYGRLLGAEQGVGIVLHSYYPDQSFDDIRTVAEWADVVGADPSIRAALAEAEVVVLLIGYHDVIPALMFGACPSDWPAMRDCLAKATAPMPAAFAKLYGAVAELVPEGATVLVNDFGIPVPVYEGWGSEPYWPDFRRAAFEDWRDALEAAAQTTGFTVVHTYAALNDENGAPRPTDKALTVDGWHFNADGRGLIANLMLEQDGLQAP